MEGFAGKYDAVAVVDYQPSTTFTTSDILTQSLSVSVDKTLEATSLWYIDGSGKWIVLDDTSEDSTEDATKAVFTYAIPANSPVIPTGTMVLMGGELVGGALPNAAISNFAIDALKGGAIGMSWDFENLPLRAGDNVRLIITDGTAEVVNQTVPESKTARTLSQDLPLLTVRLTLQPLPFATLKVVRHQVSDRLLRTSGSKAMSRQPTSPLNKMVRTGLLSGTSQEIPPMWLCGTSATNALTTLTQPTCLPIARTWSQVPQVTRLPSLSQQQRDPLPITSQQFQWMLWRT